MKTYRSFFNINELQAEKPLQILYWALVCGFIISFYFWVEDRSVLLESVSRGKFVCPTYFQNCNSIYFLSEKGMLSIQFFYSILFLILLASAVAAFKQRWGLAHALLWPVTIWKIIYLFFMAFNAGTDFEYFHLPVLIVFLLSKDKLYFSRLVFTVVYSLAVLIKLDASWIAGIYFSSLRGGLPFFPDSSIPFITNLVIVFEIFFPWLLLSNQKHWRNASLSLWVIFHIYSIQLVGFRYPLHCLTMILALFYSPSTFNTPKFTFKSAPGFIVVLGLYIVSLLSFFVSGDAKYNLNDLKMGVRMFDANHQCLSFISVAKGGRQPEELQFNNKSAMKRCSPYPFWFEAQQLCKSQDVQSVGWKFYSSVNGGPFFNLVNTENICHSEYSLFSENSWYHEPTPDSELLGYPRKNSLLDTINPPVSEMVYSIEERSVSDIQLWLLENLALIKKFYLVTWIFFSAFMLFKYFVKPATKGNAE